MKMQQVPPSFPIFLLRLGLGTVFLYAALSSFLQPPLWIGFFPTWLQAILPKEVLLFLFALFEVFLALWLYSPWKTPLAALVAMVTLSFIIIANITVLDVVFRDIAILFAAITLALLARGEPHHQH